MDKPIDEMLEEFGRPDEPMPVAPPWHVESYSCLHGGILGGTQWGICDCEDPANPWPAREPGDGPVDCSCFNCGDDVPRHMRGKIDSCKHKNHHCDACHDLGHCTIAECGFR